MQFILVSAVFLTALTIQPLFNKVKILMANRLMTRGYDVTTDRVTEHVTAALWFISGLE